MRSLLGTVIWVVVFLFHHFKYFLPFPSGLKSFFWKISCYPYGNPLVCYLMFSPDAFNICSLYLIFNNLINMCPGVFGLGFILFGTFSVSWTWVAISFLILGKFSNYYLFKYFFMVFLFVLFFWDSYDLNVGVFDIVPEVSEVFFIFLIFFFLSASFPPSYLPPHLSSASVSLLFVFSRVECFWSQLFHYSLLIDPEKFTEWHSEEGGRR